VPGSGRLTLELGLNAGVDWGGGNSRGYLTEIAELETLGHQIAILGVLFGAHVERPLDHLKEVLLQQVDLFRRDTTHKGDVVVSEVHIIVELGSHEDGSKDDSKKWTRRG